MECPQCHLINPPEAERCDCGFRFVESDGPEAPCLGPPAPHPELSASAARGKKLASDLLRLRQMRGDFQAVAGALQERLAEEQRTKIVFGNWRLKLAPLLRRHTVTPQQQLHLASARYVERLDSDTRAEYSGSLAALRDQRADLVTTATTIFWSALRGSKPKRSRLPADWREKITELIRGWPEQEFYAATQRFRAEFDTSEWTAQYGEALGRGGRSVDLTRHTAELRADMGWRPQGSVLGYPNASAALNEALLRVEQYGSAVPMEEAVRFMALLDPDGPEAFYLAQRQAEKSDAPSE